MPAHETFLETHPRLPPSSSARTPPALSPSGSSPIASALRRREGDAGASRCERLVESTTTYTGGRDSDRGTKRILVGGMIAGLFGGWLAARYVPAAELPGNAWVWVVLGVLVAWAGLALRLAAIVALGRYFRRDVVVEAGQRIVRRGPYRFVRHPAYTGNLLAALGLGLALGNWLSVVALVVLPFLGHLPRIRIEEVALEGALGEPYRAYEAEIARLVPGVW